VQLTFIGRTAIPSLAGTYGGITGNVNICKDSNAFSGPEGG